MNVTLPLVLSTGLLDSFNPCAISVILLFISVLFTIGKSRREILGFGLTYVASVFVTYFIIGLFYYQLLGLLTKLSTNNISGYMIFIAAILTIFFGVLNIKEYFFPNLGPTLRIPFKIREMASKLAFKADIFSAIILGVIIAASELPCSGSVYIGILTYLKFKTTVISGMIYLGLYNLMFVSPLLIILGVASNKILTERFINWQERMGRKMHLLLAILMISLGIGMIFLI